MVIDPHTAFISYSREDWEFVLRLAKDLKVKAAKVWMDKLDIRPGQRWEREVETALNNCSRMLVILSPTSVGSSNVLAEAAFAIDEGKEVIPVLYLECKIPFRLRPFQYADFRTSYDEGLQELLATLGSNRATDTAAATTAATPAAALAERERKAAGEKKHRDEHLGTETSLRLRLTVGGIAVAIVLAVVAGVLLRTNFVSVINKTKPLAYFRLDSKAGVSEVGARSYSFSNGVTSSAWCAPIGITNNRCALLNGIDGKIETSQAGGIADSGSVMIWLSLASLPSTERRVFYVAGESEFRNDFDIQILADDTLAFFTDRGTYITYRPDPGTLVNRWHMVVATLDKGVQTLYWDGKQVQSGGGGAGNKSSEFSIGDSTVFKGRFFHGSLDEVALWNRALSASEVATIYASATTFWGRFFRQDVNRAKGGILVTDHLDATEASVDLRQWQDLFPPSPFLDTFRYLYAIIESVYPTPLGRTNPHSRHWHKALCHAYGRPALIAPRTNLCPCLKPAVGLR